MYTAGLLFNVISWTPAFAGVTEGNLAVGASGWTPEKGLNPTRVEYKIRLYALPVSRTWIIF
jgi:hypothetical protein